MPIRSGSYAQAGVDIEAYERVLDRVKALAQQTHGLEVTKGVGHFSGLFELPGGGLQLAATADGVGTKIKVAITAGRHHGLGLDLVNHCVNDLAVMGAAPLFFLDYFACGRLDEAVLLEVVAGVSEACQQAGCALLGGETAELPGMYTAGDYDLAGFAVGLVEPARIPDPNRVRIGDVLLALPSSGLHTNGFSLVRKVFADVDLDHVFPELGRPLWQELLIPHLAYGKRLQQLWPRWKVAAHITGGGVTGNVPRVLPDGVAAHVESSAWPVPSIFRLIQRRGAVAEEEMFRTFNMGLGIVLVASPQDAEALTASGLLRVGEVVEQEGSSRVIFS